MRLEGEEDKPWAWNWIAAMINEPGLWPVLLVGTCLLLGLVALVVVRTFQGGNWFLMAGVGALLATTVVSGIRDACMGRIGVVSRIVVSLWGLAILAAFISMTVL